MSYNLLQIQKLQQLYYKTLLFVSSSHCHQHKQLQSEFQKMQLEETPEKTQIKLDYPIQFCKVPYPWQLLYLEFIICQVRDEIQH